MSKRWLRSRILLGVLMLVVVVTPAVGQNLSHERRQKLRQQQREAQQYLTDEDYTRALRTYADLWKNRVRNKDAVFMHQASMVTQLTRLCESDPRSHRHFTRQRDRLEKKGQAPKYADQLRDWVILNAVIGETGHTLAWFDEVRHDSERGQLLHGVSSWIADALVAESRFADLVVFYPDPLGELGGMKRDHDQRVEARRRDNSGFSGYLDAVNRSFRVRFTQQAARRYVSRLAAGEPALASEIWDFVRTALPEPEVAVKMLNLADRAGLLTAAHTELIAGFPTGTPGLRPLQERLEAVVAEAKAAGEVLTVELPEEGQGDEAVTPNDGEISPFAEDAVEDNAQGEVSREPEAAAAPGN